MNIKKSSVRFLHRVFKGTQKGLQQLPGQQNNQKQAAHYDPSILKRQCPGNAKMMPVLPMLYRWRERKAPWS
jgi:hypothetical protein